MKMQFLPKQEISTPKRIIGLDLLRGVAILLVLFRHSDLEQNILQEVGWLGVDLFFVLSGFLISTLLFKEYSVSGNIKIKRFLFRRSFKIFPPFYFFIIVFLIVEVLVFKSTFTWKQLVSELFYLQSYYTGTCSQTWSLAVEEHFYILFAGFVFLLSKFKLINHQANLYLFCGLLLLTIVLRIIHVYPHRNEDSFTFFQTHLRSDGILIGVILGYAYQFSNIISRVLYFKKVLFILSVMLIVPGFYFSAGSYFMNTIGITGVDLGFGILLLLVMNLELNFKNWYKRSVISFFCFIGINSYSIYLWHLLVKEFVDFIPIEDTLILNLLYMFFAIFIGIIFSYGIEKPSLILREKTEKYFAKK